MTPRRRDRAAPPPRKGEWDCRFASNDAAKSWEQLGASAPNNVRAAWEHITANPRHRSKRQKRLRHALATATVNGIEMPQWQFEVTGGGRIWYCFDDDKKTIWLTAVHIGHPKATE